MLLTKGTGGDIALVEGLKNKVQALKSRCDMLERTSKDLKSICDMHQRTLEIFQ